MTTLDLEKLAKDATAKVANLVPNSCLSDDGGGEYLSVHLTEDESGEYLVIAVPVLFNGEEATWGANDGNHNRYWESDFTIHTDAETIAEWVNSVVLPEATTEVK